MHRDSCHTRRRFWFLPLVAISAVGCQIELPVAASRYAGCWRFQVRLVSADGARANIDRDFIIELDNTGALSRVVMRREGEAVSNPLDPGATFVDLISAQAAATLQASLFPERLNPDPTEADVVFSSTVEATTLGFNVAASITVVPSEDVRYAVNLRVRVDGTTITDVRERSSTRPARTACCRWRGSSTIPVSSTRRCPARSWSHRCAAASMTRPSSARRRDSSPMTRSPGWRARRSWPATVRCK